MQAAGFPPAPWVDEMLAQAVRLSTSTARQPRLGVYNPAQRRLRAHPAPGRAGAAQPEQKAAGKVIKKNPGANLIDLGDGVACVEFHTKMNALDDDIFNMIQHGLDVIEKDFDGLVIGNEAENFSAGANLFLVVMGAQNGNGISWTALVKNMQDTCMRMRYFPKPVVVARPGWRWAAARRSS